MDAVDPGWALSLRPCGRTARRWRGAEHPGHDQIIGDDSLRRALNAIAPAPDAKHTESQRAAQQAQLARSTQWMQDQLKHSIAQATTTAWILDCDTTIKVLYGKQDGSVVSYNPHKPGRPSHAIRTYWIGNLRLVLDAQLEPGNRHSPAHARPGLLALLEGMPQAQRPKLVRGDCAYGSEGEMSALEAIGQPYLSKLRQSAVSNDWCSGNGRAAIGAMSVRAGMHAKTSCGSPAGLSAGVSS